MVDLSVSIDIKNKEDLDIIIDTIKTLGIENPVFIVEEEGKYFVSYETNEYSERIENALKYKFNYLATEKLDVGNSDVHVIVTTTQSPMSSDNWGRQFNSDSITNTIYFMKDQGEEASKVPNLKYKALFDSEEREYQVYVTEVTLKQEQEQKKGFIVTKSPFVEGQKPDLLSDKLFKEDKPAFWAGYFKMKSIIESDYAEFVKTKKKRRKKS